jgi:hypothetical protein
MSVVPKTVEVGQQGMWVSLRISHVTHAFASILFFLHAFASILFFLHAFASILFFLPNLFLFSFKT